MIQSERARPAATLQASLRIKLAFWVALVVSIVSVGCGGQSTVPVTGVVTMNGAPVVGAAVNFSPIDPNSVPSLGATDSEGRFTLTTSTDLPGAMPGSFRVTVYHAQFGNAPSADAQGNMGEASPSGVQILWLVPERYSRFDTSGLTAEVRKGMPDLKFELTSP